MKTTKTSDTLPNLDYLSKISFFASKVAVKHKSIFAQLLAHYPLDILLTKNDIQTIIASFDCQSRSFDFSSIQGKSNECGELVNHYTVETLSISLRVVRDLLMARWIWQDVLNKTNVIQLTTELSHFSDSCISIAQGVAYQSLTPRFGVPKNTTGKRQELIIIAMGKLGAGELNLSSDIDLIFSYNSDGFTDVSDCTHAKPKQIDTKRFMVLWGQAVIRILDEVTVDGFVFRVDMRLRPWGDGSEMASSFKTLTNYFNKHGRAWERFAWLKARAITGKAQDIAELDALIQRFVYRYYFDYTAFSALREMKNLIQNQQRQRGDEDNVKLGAGGIRDIEFIVQSQQLIYGGHKNSLQVKNCLQALGEIVAHGYIRQINADGLHSAYVFLRKAEHAIQALRDQQTQKLPKDADDQQRVALYMGFDSYADLLQQLQKHKAAVTQEFESIVVNRDEQTTHAELREQQPDTLFASTEEMLHEFLHSKFVKSLPHVAQTRLENVWDNIRSALSNTICESEEQSREQQEQNQLRACKRMLAFIESVCKRSIYLVLLKEHPYALTHLVTMMNASPWIANELTYYPVLLDEFLLNRNKPLASKEALSDKLRQQMLRVEPDDEEGQLKALRLFKKSEVLHVATKDVINHKALMQVSDSLTWIAEAVVEQTLICAYAHVVKKHGYPVLSNTGERATPEHNGFGIIGYGKLGGIELSYSSDLDVVFLHTIDEHKETDGKRPISGLHFVTRLAKKVMTMLSTQTRDGRAYEIDLRLRPSGNAGVMVSSLNAFERYQQNLAWVWEYQALVRARAITGDKAVLDAFNNIRKQTLCTKRDEVETKAEVVKMRQKMRDHLGSNKTDQENGLFHLKHDAGGIVDIEFLTQFAVLMSSHEHPEVVQYTDNVRNLESLVAAGFIAQEEASVLIESYIKLRCATHAQALAQEGKQVKLQDWQAVVSAVSKLWHNYLNT